MRTRHFGYIIANPAEFAIQRRRGRTRRSGRGISFFCLPLIDRYYIIPSSAQSIGFTADQITSENQGVEVAGFAIWKVGDPEKASASFDFVDASAAIASIGENLRNVVESAIRYQVANMTIEDVLRKRGTIIVQLKNELADIASGWGLTIETIEIRNVRVLSEQLFKQMQAPFRDKMRLESEASSLETEKSLAEKRIAHKEQIALQEQDFEHRDLERKSEAQRLKISADAEVQATKLDRQRQLVANEESLHAAQATLAIERQRHQAALAAIEDETRRRQIQISNTEDHGLALVRQMPALLGALKVNELNVGEDTIGKLMRSVDHLLGRSDRTSIP